MSKLTPEEIGRIKAMQELDRLRRLDKYQKDFEKFSEDELKVLPKGASKLKPLKLLEPQRILNDVVERQLRDTGMVRVIVLKARQQYISTYCIARTYHDTTFNDYRKACIIAQDAKTASELFDMTRRFHDNLSTSIKLETTTSSKNEMKFKENKSKYNVLTAGSSDSGRGFTPTSLVGSEVAFWTCGYDVQAGLISGIPNVPGTFIFLESTSDGPQGMFYDLYMSAKNDPYSEFEAVFIPWFATEEYVDPVPDDFEKTEEEVLLAAEHGLSDGALCFRRRTIARIGLSKFRHEYPSTDDEAFLSADNSVFPSEILDYLRPQEPRYREQWVPTEGRKTFVEDKFGDLKTWQPRQFDGEYVIGVDVAKGIKLDYSVATVMKKNKEVVAIYRSKTIDTIGFAEVLAELGRRYNNCLIALENNGVGESTLMHLHSVIKYRNLYSGIKIGPRGTELPSERLGFNSNSSSKTRITSNLRRALEEEELDLRCSTAHAELREYSSKHSDRSSYVFYSAPVGKHDDIVDSLAIAIEAIRTHPGGFSDGTVGQPPVPPSDFSQDETVWL